MHKALDALDDVLKKLKKKEEEAQNRLREGANPISVADAQTSTTNLCPAYASSLNTTRSDTSVLIKRRPVRHLNNSKVQKHHKNESDKTKVNKKRCASFERNNQRHSNCGSKIGQRSDVKVQNDKISSSNHPRQDATRHDGYYQSTRGRNVQDVRDAHGEIMRHAHSQEEINERESIWVPPLSQSSPRVLRSRSISGSRHLDHHISSGEMDPPRSSSVRSGSLKDQSSRGPKPFKPTLPLSVQGYAEPTLTSKLRVKLSEGKEKPRKENIVPYIPSGHTNKSHHVGVIMQKKLGLLKNIPQKELENIIEPFNQLEKQRNKELDSKNTGPTEDVIRLALENIEEHIALVSRQSGKQKNAQPVIERLV